MKLKKRKKIKIIFFTGSRADFTTMKLVIDKIKKKNIKIIIYFSGSHFLDILGNTFRTYYKDYKNYEIKKIDFFRKIKNFDTKKIFNEGKKIIFKQLSVDTPDYIYILGDRYEAMIAALAAFDLGTKIIHAGGGETTLGSKDNYYRKIISKKAFIHFATTKQSFFRLKKKFSKSKVYFVGSPIVAQIKKFKKRKKLKHKFFKGDKYALMTFHPSIKSIENISKLMSMSIKILLNLKYKILITYPNQDPGYIRILNIIKKYKKNRNILTKKNLANKYFYALDNAEFMIGNSSSGIIEAPYFKKKVINIGLRQKGRLTDKTIINVKSVINKFEINLLKAIKKKINKSSSNFYGSANSNEKQVNIIAKLLN